VDEIRAEYEAEKEEEAGIPNMVVSSSGIDLDGETNHTDNVELITATEEEKAAKPQEFAGAQYDIAVKLPPIEKESAARRKIFDVASGDTFEGSERTYLLSTVKKPQMQKKSPPEPYGSNNDLDASSTGSVGSTLVRSMSGFGSGFMSRFRNNHVNKCKEAMKAVDTQSMEFSALLYQELDKVNDFFDGKCAYLERELGVLLESAKFLDDSIVSEKKHRRTASDNLKSRIQKRLSVVMLHGKVGGTPSSPTKKRNNQPTTYNKEDNLSFVLQHDDEDEELEDVVAAASAAGHNEADMIKVLHESESIKRALRDLDRTAKLLSNFAIINYTGFVKIIKKFNKTFPDSKGQFDDITGDRICQEGKVPLELAEKMEGLYAKWFCEGNLTQAQAQMLPKKGDGLNMDWSQLRLGYRLGMCSILALWVCWDCVWGLVRDGHSTIGGRTAFPVFRACAGLLLVHWFWGLSVFIWTRYRVNYIFLFDFNPRIVDTPITIYNDCVDETLVFMILMLLYYKAGANDIPQILPDGFYPLFLVLFTVKELIFPWRKRAPLWTAIWHVITSPIYLPTFFLTYVADVFTSMVKVFQDILWTLCFVISGDFLIPDNSDEQPRHWQHTFWYKNVVIPLICLFPLWIRFSQCLRKYYDTRQRFPHLANAFKYALSQTVTLFGAFHPLYLLTQNKNVVTVSAVSLADDDELYAPHYSRGMNLFQMFWVGAFVTSSLYSWCWDVYMDWGLGRPKYMFLGPRLMYPKRLHYYGVIFIDLFLRFMWVLTLIPPQSGASFEVPNYLSAFTMSVELLRRTLWGFFRLENEHRHNTAGYRRVDFVPLHFSTGHDHKYKQKERAGWNVLAEVAAVTTAVLSVSAASVIVAHKASQIESRGEL